MEHSLNTADQKQKIVEAATSVFARDGYGESNVSQIAIEAGISKGTIYLYFDSKSELLYNIFEQFNSAMHETLDQTIKEIQENGFQLERFTQKLATIVQSNPNTIKVLFDFWSNSLRGNQLGAMNFNKIYGRIRGKVKQILDIGIDQGVFESNLPDQLPFVLIGFFEGLIIHWLSNPDSPPLEDMVRPATRSVLKGLET